jgi:hypothetical protein
VTPAQEVRIAADALWDREPNPTAELFSLEEQPRSWSVALGQLAWEMERAGEDAPLLLRWRQAIEIARSVNATTGDPS